MQRARKGFTLAELLIVVAIIAVLVGISIPIFTTQLEKSRESVDLANVRSAYAVLIASVVADSTSSVDDISVDGDRFYTIVPLHQSTDDWQTPLPLTIAGVSSTDSVHWVGIPKAGGTCRIEYDCKNEDYTSALTFYWDGEGSSGSTPAEPVDPADPDSPAGPLEPGDPVAPPDEPEETPGGSDGDFGGGSGSSIAPDHSLPQVLIEGAEPYPIDGDTKDLLQGHLYSYNGKVYVVLPDKITFNPWYKPTPETEGPKDWGFAELRPDAPVYNTPGHFNSDITKGSLYVIGDDVYIRRIDHDWWDDPIADPANWQLIIR